MYATVYVPVLLSVLLIPLVRFGVRRIAPDMAVKLLTTTTVLAAVCSAWGLFLLAGARLSQEGFVAREGHWSSTTLAASNPVPRWAGATAAVLLATAAFRCVLLGWGQVVVARAKSDLKPGAGQLVVLDDPAPRAFALPGRHPRIVVTTGMLRGLTPLERRVLLAHERAHLRHHHHRYQLALNVAAALNPLVGMAGRDLRFALERWADEEAAKAVNDRAATAASVVHAARLSIAVSGSEAGFAFAQLGVVDRVTALGHAAPPPRRALAVSCLMLFGLPALWASADATLSLVRLLLTATGHPSR